MISIFRKNLSLFFAILSLCFFVGVTSWRGGALSTVTPGIEHGRVVVNAPVLTFLYGGDRYLAANIESMRLAVTYLDYHGRLDSHYLTRAQLVVAELNPCHEDNYYLANGLLAWGGAVAEGNEILLRATKCRFWDGVPPFFYGVNRSLFDRDIESAVSSLELSADRWPENQSSLRRMAIMLRVEEFDDAKLALNYLKKQRDETRDLKLRGLLDLRVERLDGLLRLRMAKQRYEQEHGELVDLQQLVMSGELTELPVDPLQLGYELRNGKVELSRLEILGATK